MKTDKNNKALRVQRGLTRQGLTISGAKQVVCPELPFFPSSITACNLGCTALVRTNHLRRSFYCTFTSVSRFLCLPSSWFMGKVYDPVVRDLFYYSVFPAALPSFFQLVRLFAIIEKLFPVRIDSSLNQINIINFSIQKLGLQIQNALKK